MKLEDLVDIEKLTKGMTPPNRGTFQTWISTALEISPDCHRDIAIIRGSYMEIPKEELRPQQIVSFLEALLDVMPSVEAKKTLIRTEALQFRKFDF